MKVLRVFMSLPIILTAKDFIAGQECAAIRPLVTLHVLLQFARASFEFFTSLAGDLVFTLVTGNRSGILDFWRVTGILLDSISKITNNFKNFQGLLLSLSIFL
jgi:hypothetical protein